MNEKVLIFVDDIIIYSSTIEEHFERLELVFHRMASHSLKIEPSKCFLFQKSVSYLGQIISCHKQYVLSFFHGKYVCFSICSGVVVVVVDVLFRCLAFSSDIQKPNVP